MPNITFIEPGSNATCSLLFYTTQNGTPISESGGGYNGTHAIKCNSGAGNSSNSVDKTNILNSNNNRVNFYVRFSGLPTSTADFYQQHINGSFQYRLRLSPDGRLVLANSAGTNYASGNPSISSGVWYRICTASNITDQTTNTVNVYRNGGLDIGVQNVTLSTSTSNMIRLGWDNTNGGPGALKVVNFDSVCVEDNSNSTSDVGNVLVAAKRPAAHQVNTFGTAIGNNPSNRWENVNERPLSTTNGWSTNGASQTEVYKLEPPISGLNNLTSGTILAYQGWLYGSKSANQTLSANLITNSRATSIALANGTNNLFYSTILSGEYPTDTASGVGIIKLSGNPAARMYECGVVIAYKAFINAVSHTGEAFLYTIIETALQGGVVFDNALQFDSISNQETNPSLNINSTSVLDSITNTVINSNLSYIANLELTTNYDASFTGGINYIGESQLHTIQSLSAAGGLSVMGDAPLSIEFSASNNGTITFGGITSFVGLSSQLNSSLSLNLVGSSDLSFIFDNSNTPSKSISETSILHTLTETKINASLTCVGNVSFVGLNETQINANLQIIGTTSLNTITEGIFTASVSVLGVNTAVLHTQSALDVNANLQLSSSSSLFTHISTDLQPLRTISGVVSLDGVTSCIINSYVVFGGVTTLFILSGAQFNPGLQIIGNSSLSTITEGAFSASVSVFGVNIGVFHGKTAVDVTGNLQITSSSSLFTQFAIDAQAYRIIGETINLDGKCSWLANGVMNIGGNTQLESKFFVIGTTETAATSVIIGSIFGLFKYNIYISTKKTFEVHI